MAPCAHAGGFWVPTHRPALEGAPAPQNTAPWPYRDASLAASTPRHPVRRAACNAAQYPTLEKFKGAIKIALGVTEEFVRPGGATELMPGSIAFNKMDEIEFAEFYDSAVALICSRIIPGIDSESLKHEVLDLIGG